MEAGNPTSTASNTAKIVAIVVVSISLSTGAAQASLSTPAPATIARPATVRLTPPESGLGPEMPDSTGLLVVGGVLVGFGMVGRKRRTEETSRRG